MMYTTQIQPWGNSQAIRIPKPLLDSVPLKVNDPVEITIEDGSIVIRKASKSLRERFAGYHGEYHGEEWDTGEPIGKED